MSTMEHLAGAQHKKGDNISVPGDHSRHNGMNALDLYKENRGAASKHSSIKGVPELTLTERILEHENSNHSSKKGLPELALTEHILEHQNTKNKSAGIAAKPEVKHESSARHNAKLFGEGLVSGAVFEPINGIITGINKVFHKNIHPIGWANQAEVDASPAGKAAEWTGRIVAGAAVGAATGGVGEAAAAAGIMGGVAAGVAEGVAVGAAKGAALGGLKGAVDHAFQEAGHTRVDTSRVRLPVRITHRVASGKY